ncbi:MAG: hypothetical protein WCC63_04395 [Candidatus Bathyarchaeia archaeon]
MRGLCRIAVYVFITVIVEAVLTWGLFAYAEADKLTIWFILAENFGMLLFPPYQGPTSSGFYALVSGILCWFLIITAAGETTNWLRRKRGKVLSQTQTL